MLNIWKKRNNIDNHRGKDQVTYKGKPSHIIPDFSVETLKAKRTWTDVLYSNTTDSKTDCYTLENRQ